MDVLGPVLFAFAVQHGSIGRSVFALPAYSPRACFPTLVVPPGPRLDVTVLRADGLGR